MRMLHEEEGTVRIDLSALRKKVLLDRRKLHWRLKTPPLSPDERDALHTLLPD